MLKGKTWQERYDWIVGQKDETNKLFKSGVYDQAIDGYLKALCGLDFGKQTAEEEDRVNKELKAPILNNIAACLIKQGKLQRANIMLEKVLQADPENFKAWTRKVANLIKLGEVDQAKKALTKTEKLAITLEDKA